jgi:hypothetical protein
MDPVVIAAIIGAVATIVAAWLAYAPAKRRLIARREKWYTRWTLGRVFHETLELKITAAGAVTGTRTTISEGGMPCVFEVAGHVHSGFYWLDYHEKDGPGGGSITLLTYTPGRLVGLVTTIDCNGALLLCRTNQWVPFDQGSSYTSSACATVAKVAVPAA